MAADMPALCFGGSFNPIHNGHLLCAEAVANRAGYGRVLLIPTGQPPHKPGDAGLAPAADRLAMCRLAIAGRRLFDVSDLEMRRGGPSYTLDTVLELKKQGWPRVDWLIGADMLMYLPKWHRVHELLEEANFLVMQRPGWAIDWQALPEVVRRLEAKVVEAPQIDVSATEIRRRARSGAPIDDLTPKSVANYVVEHHLYQT